jgi:hypothetical protein
MQSTNTSRTDAPASSLSARLTLGATGGLVAGAVFIALNLWFASAAGKPTLAPFKMISTLVQGPPPTAGTVSVGIVTHFVLSLLLGLVFAALTYPWANAGVMAFAGLLYGGLIYLINFQVLSRYVDYWSAFLKGTNQPFELAAHLTFGAVLALFLIPVARGASR